MAIMKVRTLAEFMADHATDVDKGVRERSETLFPTGAVVKQTLGGRAGDEAVMYEPPTDDHKRLQIIKAYWRIRTDRAEREFFRVRSGYSEALANATTFVNFPQPDESCLEDLKNLRATAIRCRQKLNEVEAELDETPERKQRAAVQARIERDQEKARRLLTQVNSFRLDDDLEALHTLDEAVEEFDKRDRASVGLPPRESKTAKREPAKP